MTRCKGRCGREGKAKGGKGGRGNPELRKPTEAEEGYGPDAATGTGAHTGAHTVADTARGSQGGEGGLGAPGRSGSGCAKRLERLHALSLFRAGAAGCLREGRGRARDGVSGLLLREGGFSGWTCGRRGRWLWHGCGREPVSVRARRARLQASGVRRGKGST